MYACKILGITGQIPCRAPEQRARSHFIASGMVVECYGNLNQSLKKFLFFPSRRTPDIFEHFMSVEKLGMVEQADSMKKAVAVHVLF